MKRISLYIILALAIITASCSDELTVPDILLNSDGVTLCTYYDWDDDNSFVLVTASGDWKAQTSEPWIIVNPDSGTQCKETFVSISVTDFPTDEDRRGMIFFTSGGDTATFEVYQSFRKIMNLSEDLIECGSEACDIDIEVETNFTFDYGYFGTPNWVHLSKKDINGAKLNDGMKSKSILSVHIDKNTSRNDREVGISLGVHQTFESCGSIIENARLVVKQSRDKELFP